MRDHGLARAAPGCPDVEDDDLAFEISQAGRLAFQVFAHEGRYRAADRQVGDDVGILLAEDLLDRIDLLAGFLAVGERSSDMILAVRRLKTRAGWLRLSSVGRRTVPSPARDSAHTRYAFAWSLRSGLRLITSSMNAFASSSLRPGKHLDHSQDLGARRIVVGEDFDGPGSAFACLSGRSWLEGPS